MEVVSMRDYKTQKEHDEMKKQEAILLQETTHNTSPPPTTTASPPSSSTSPSHEFSFTISLDPHPPPKSTQHTHNHNTYITTTTTNNNNNNIINNNHCLTVLPSPPEPVTAIDLSPADDIFFQGHLLPLHPSISPRSSTNSMDGFTLPTGNTSFRHHHHHRINTFSDFNLPCNINTNQTKPKSKSFSIFARPDWKKESPDEETANPKKKPKLADVAKLIKRYMKMVTPFMSFRKTKKSNNRQPPHSFSSNCLSSRTSLPVEMNRACLRRGRFSAPASMRTSPANSGILASGTLSPAKSTASDSTMEELQAAIQAAIAHCKNSIATEDKVQA